ncbi:MAG: DUF2490 domain-containing protein [Methyloprofundus sp.]|uniref:DUF2490 domain-containing protein n=1 Tax=Methyloprofundus sp. TaxID=2020875 RepID=UPI00260CC07C|nr:DUF2490 domain-containing protein [Methyloprofundus sp.]
MKMIFPLICVLAILPWSNATAETVDKFGIWGAIQGQGSFTHADSELRKWQWWMEGQGRWFNNASQQGQSIVRPGIGYQLSDQVSVWLGYAWVRTYPEGQDHTDEHRIWQQLSWNKPYSWGGLATRTRLEQRFLNTGNDAGWRFRQFLKYTYPIFSERIYLSLWDEVFVNMNSTDWGAKSGFGQNRLFTGLGFFVDSKQHYRFELGYINQFVNLESQNNQMDHLISGSLFIRY